mgnify:CR=1 FL=1
MYPESKEKYKKAIEVFVECDTLGNRLPITSFLHMDCDSSFSVVIPRTTFVDCLTRFVHHRLIKSDSGAFIFHGEKLIEKVALNEAVFIFKKIDNILLFSLP